MTKLIFIPLALALSFIFMQFSANKSHGKWEKLGTKTVNMKLDHDEIMVTAKDGVFTAVKFKVMSAPVKVISVKVVFGNGQTEFFKVNKQFAPESESRVLDLPGNKRIIKKIVFNYVTKPNPKGKAKISVLGRH
jgi:hypothetical protein